MIYVISFALLVALIGLVTNRLNAVTLCQHDWEDADHSFKCCKCSKVIPDYSAASLEPALEESLREAA
jgi:hypothetical protein